MSRSAKHLEIYERYHQELINKILHFIGIPLTIFAILIFFGWIHIKVPMFFEISLAWILSLSLIIYYCYLDLRLGLVFAVFLIILNIIASFISQPAPSLLGLKIFLITFILGLIMQIIGHLVEGNTAGLRTKLFSLLITGPLFITAEVFFLLHYRQDLMREIEMERTISS